jgi:hypothetical protein
MVTEAGSEPGADLRLREGQEPNQALPLPGIHPNLAPRWALPAQTLRFLPVNRLDYPSRHLPLRLRSIPGSIGAAKTGLPVGLSRRDGAVAGIAWCTGSSAGSLRLGRIAGTMISRTGIALLHPIGWLELPVFRVLPLGDGRPGLLPLARVIIAAVDIVRLVARMLWPSPAVGLPVLVTLTLMAIPAVGVGPGLLPPMLLTIHTLGVAAGLLPLTMLAIPPIGMAPGLLPMMRLAIPAHSIAMGLGPGECLTLRLRGKRPIRRPIRSGLGAQRTKGHEQTRGENNAPPSSWVHVIILL